MIHGRLAGDQPGSYVSGVIWQGEVTSLKMEWLKCGIKPIASPYN
jgi:hypothetical protein